MRPLTHRDPGIVGAALVRPDVVVQAIVDGVHLDRDVVRLLWSVAAGRFALVTDSISAAGLGDGDFGLGSVDLAVSDGIARRGDGVLAGSTLTMIQALRTSSRSESRSRGSRGRVTRSCRCPRARDLGRLGIGRRADVVVLDDNLEIERVLVAGETRVAG